MSQQNQHQPKDKWLCIHCGEYYKHTVRSRRNICSKCLHNDHIDTEDRIEDCPKCLEGWSLSDRKNRRSGLRNIQIVLALAKVKPCLVGTQEMK